MGKLKYEKGLRIPREAKATLQQYEDTIDAFQQEIQNAEEQIGQAFREQEELLGLHGLRLGFDEKGDRRLVIKA